MKKLFLIGLYLFCMSLSAQENYLEIGNNYYFNSTLNEKLSKQKINLENDALSINENLVKQGYKINVVDIKGNKVFFKYLRFTYDSLRKIYNGDNDEDKIFSTSKEEFQNLTEKYYNTFRGFRYGAYSVPIRLSGKEGSFEFDSNLSLGANIIARLGLRKHEFLYLDFSLGLSLSKVNLNPENSLLGDPGGFEDITVLSPAALSISFGALINLAKNLNAGIYLGWDHLSSADNKAGWIYNKKPWWAWELILA